MTWTTRRRSEIGGLAAIAAGAGQNVLLLHGVGLRAEAWGAQLDALAAVGRIVAPDMPGHGDSEMLSGPFDIERYTDAAQNVLTRLDGPTVIVGHSMGAMVALCLAARVPDQVCGVAALNAVYHRSAEARAAVCTRAAALDGQTRADPKPTLRRWFGEADSAARRACETWLTTVDPVAYKSAYTAFAQSEHPTATLLAAIRCPALFMTGSLEPNSTPDMSCEMASLTQNGRVHIVDGAAHMMPMTHAAQVNAVLTDLLSEVQA